eukprot:scaffold8246_cov74-Skeletonema_dohrnii-CCMP3373.AAC.2
MGIRMTKESQLTDMQLREKFSYTEAFYAKDANNNKQAFSTYRPSEFGPYTERNLMMFNDLVTYCDKTSIDGEARLELLDTVFEGDVRREWDDLRNRGNDHWDPAALPIDNASVRKAMEALLTEVLNDATPGNTQHQKLLDIQYKLVKDQGFFIKPTLYYKRLEYLWHLSKWLPRQGAPPDDSAKLDSQIRGVPEAWMQWLEHRNRDIRDLANNGAQPWTCQDLFNELDQYWAEHEEPKLKAYMDKQGKPGDKRRRRRRNNSRRNGGGKGGRNGKRRNGNDNGGGGKGNHYEKDCQLHNGGHPYKNCIYAMGQSNFDLNKAHSYAKTGKTPEWWQKCYDKGVKDWWTKSSGNKNQSSYSYQTNEPSQQADLCHPVVPVSQQQQFYQQQFQAPPLAPPQAQLSYAQMPPPAAAAAQPMLQGAAYQNVQDMGQYYLVSTPTGMKKVAK